MVVETNDTSEPLLTGTCNITENTITVTFENTEETNYKQIVFILVEEY
jgi:hypothetical protein